jgi:hypothetical protein
MSRGKGYTMSSLDRVAACPASAVLPGARSPSNRHASLGTDGHRVLQKVQDGAELADALAEVDDENRNAVGLIDFGALGGLLGSNCAAEVAVAIDLKTGKARELGRGTERDYSRATDDELCGTMDLAGVGPDLVYTGDWKLGHQRVPRARSNRQLKAYAYALMAIYKKPRAVAEIIQAPPGREPYRDQAEFSSFELAGLFLAELRDIDSRVQAARRDYEAGLLPEVRIGDHCKYCPARQTCPARIGLAARLGSPAAIEKPADILEIEITRETAATARRRARAIRKLLDDVEAQIDDLARVESIALGDGKFYGLRDKSRESVSGDKVHELILETFGAENQAAAELAADTAAPAQPRKGTKSGIKEALRVLRDAGLVTKMAPVERELLAELDDRGGVDRKSWQGLAEYTAHICRSPGCDFEAMTAGGTCRMCAIDAEMWGQP